MATRTFSSGQSALTDIRLRERHFGELEMGSDHRYEEVWKRDRLDPFSTFCGSESANHVMQRVTALVLDLEDNYADSRILLISHGDALQILQTAFLKRDASSHRELDHLDTAEIRELVLSS